MAVKPTTAVLYGWIHTYLLVRVRAFRNNNKMRAAQDNLQRIGARFRVAADATLLLTLRHQPCSSNLLLKQGTI